MDINIFEMIKPELIILIPVCWGLGFLIKSTPCPNKLIPSINAFFSVLLACLYVFASDSCDNIFMMIFIGFTQGIVCFILAWLSYEKFIKAGVEKEVKIKLNKTYVSSEEIQDIIDEDAKG